MQPVWNLVNRLRTKWSTSTKQENEMNGETCWLIACLGNPGRQYEGTRHNMGFDVGDRIIEKYGITQSGVKFNAIDVAEDAKATEPL